MADQEVPVKKNKGGRPASSTLLTPDMSKAICDALSLNVPMKFAAMRLGIAYETVIMWWRKGKRGLGGKEKQRYLNFYLAVEKAKGDAIASGLAQIHQAARGGQVVERKSVTVTKTLPDGSQQATTTVNEKVSQGQWPASAWLVERTSPEHFGQNRAEIRALERELSQAQHVIDELMLRLMIKSGENNAGGLGASQPRMIETSNVQPEPTISDLARELQGSTQESTLDATGGDSQGRGLA